MKNFILLFCSILLASCSNNALQEELTTTKQELATAKTTIEKLENQIEPEGNLVHIIFFKLQPDTDQAQLISEIKKLATIEGVKDLEVGPFEDLGDKRALSAYDMLLEMSFDDEAAYQKYQSHPTHLALKEKLKSFLAGPPATYDYMKK